MLFSLNSSDNVIIKSSSIFTLKGEFVFDEAEAVINGYTNQILFADTEVGRIYYTGNEYNNRVGADIEIRNKKVAEQVGLLKHAALERIGKDSLCYAVEQFAKQKRPAAAINNKGYFLYKQGYYDAALILLNQAVMQYPDRAVAYLNLGDCYWKMDRKTEAKLAYKKYQTLYRTRYKSEKGIPVYVRERLSDL